MNTRTAAALLAAAATLALTACSGPGHADGPGSGEHASTTGKKSETAEAGKSGETSKSSEAGKSSTSGETGKNGKPKGATTPATGQGAAAKAIGLPPEPTGAKRAQLLHDLSAVSPNIVKYEDKAVDAARNQCTAINGGAVKLDRSASQRFSYKDVTTTQAQGKQINRALKTSGFCKV
ncbi:hypothetical protein OIB37_01675 [Streptomyces sp. NBC_00820]|uniref:hypothetical protein n=1 Tax=Streptomyces sp. NBC_00820 TaxID=2975842 RepID=UPI002ED1300E|nr:hypothetical protein OIB37_01675 [Streptomyces sp. NBC_00820]